MEARTKKIERNSLSSSSVTSTFGSFSIISSVAGTGPALPAAYKRNRTYKFYTQS